MITFKRDKNIMFYERWSREFDRRLFNAFISRVTEKSGSDSIIRAISITE
jgi:hypothetical protein